MEIPHRDADQRGILRAYLEHEGFEVLDAPDGDTGLRLARDRRPDLVIGEFPMDVPGHSPFMRALREEVGCDAPVLTVTSRATRRELEAARAVSQAVLTKPASPRRVLAEVQRLLGEGSGAGHER